MAPYVRTYICTSVDSDFSDVYGSNSLKLYTKIRYGLRIMHVKYIFDIIQNVWPTCMPIYFLFDFKNGDMAAIFFLAPMITLLWPLSRKWCKIGD